MTPRSHSQSNDMEQDPIAKSPNVSHNLRLHYVNAGGMRTKIGQFYAAVSSGDHDVIVVAESWLVSSILNTALAPSGWSVFRRDRHGNANVSSLGGGILIIAREYLNPSLVLSDDNSETLWIRLDLADRSTFVGGAYVPPRSDPHVYAAVVRSCETINEHLRDTDDAVLCCDLNLPSLIWQRHDEIDNIFLPTNVSSFNGEMVDEMANLGFHQLNGSVNSYGNTLETVFCTRFDNVEILSPAPALFGVFGCSTAHAPIELTLATAAAQTSSESNHAARPFDFDRANLRDLTEELERTNWDQIFTSSSLDQKVNSFYEYLQSLLERFVPRRLKKKSWSCPWMSPALARLRNRKRAAGRRLSHARRHDVV